MDENGKQDKEEIIQKVDESSKKMDKLEEMGKKNKKKIIQKI